MIRGQDRLRLEVREAFEPTRLSPQCLISAYARLIPIRRVNLRKDQNERGEPVVEPSRRAGGKDV